MAVGSFGVVHMDPFSDRPVYTLRYIEWEITVPVLMVLCRRKQAYGHSQASFVWLLLTTPGVTATVFYIYASWLAMVITCFAWRCALVIAIFVAFFVATWDQFTYSQKINTQASKVADASPESAHQRLDERGLLAAIRRPPSNVTQTAFMLLVFQVTIFVVYGVCFLLALVGYISPVLEQAVYTFGDALAKVSLLLRSSMHCTSLNHCITTSAAAGHQPPLPSTPNDSHTIRYHTISYHTISYHTIPHHTIPYYTIPYHIIPYHAIPCHALPCHAMPYHAIPPHRFPAHGWRRVGCGVVW